MWRPVVMGVLAPMCLVALVFAGVAYADRTIVKLTSGATIDVAHAYNRHDGGVTIEVCGHTTYSDGGTTESVCGRCEDSLPLTGAKLLDCYKAADGL